MVTKRRFLALESNLVNSSDFNTCIDSHDYGCQPQGNVYLSADRSCRQLGVVLTDVLLQDIFSFCDGITLAILVQTSREFYVIGHQPELWRDLVLREAKGHAVTNVGACWKDTYVLKQQSHCENIIHKPLKIAGFFSDHFFQTHICRSFVIPNKWLTIENGTVDRVEEMSIEKFLENYEIPNRPVVLAGACKDWKAMNWKCKEYLLQTLQSEKERSFRATSGAAPFAAHFTLESYLDYCESYQLEEAPLYLFDREALLDGPLREDYFPHLQRDCPYFDPNRTKENTHDLLHLLGESRRPDHTWLIVGPQRSGSSFHIDPNATHAWNATIVGRKRWLFYPPGQTPPGIYPSPDGDDVIMPISVGEWLTKYWDAHVERCQLSSSIERPIECTVQAGDVVFIPHGWWHSVLNLDAPYNIAITHNYVSKSNLSNVLRFFENKQSQISGCRDRPGIALQPEALGNEFTKALRQHYPTWLQQAQQTRKWTCRAWEDRKNDIDASKKEHKWGNRKKKSKTENVKGNVFAKVKQQKEKSLGFSFSFL
mmetsp:Transcript_7973/g.12207  ORF Transcript_7973/g.12207 Transcript_7973/m.12207 type:complete len:539 (+) Transcript_7973:86-1702(+)